MTESNSPPGGPQMSDADRLRLLIDTVQDYALVTLDTNNRIVSWNTGAERLLGYGEAEVLGHSGEIFFTVEDQVKGEVEKEIETAERHGRAQDERWHRRKDGSTFWGSGVMYAERDDSGELRGFVKIFRDETARRNMECALEEREEQLRLAVENVREYALFQLDANGSVSGWNPGAVRIFGYDRDEVLGGPVHKLFTPEDVQAGYIEDELDRTVREGGVEDARWVVRKNGTRFFARWSTNPIRDDSGQLRGFVKVLLDETDRKRQEQLRDELQNKERTFLKSELTAGTEALTRTKHELERLAASLLTVQEEERRRIARELHDDLSQRLARLEMRVSEIRKQLRDEAVAAHAALAELADELATLSSDVRDLSHRLHSSILDDLGLAVALRSLIKDFQSKWSEPVVFDIGEVPDEIRLDVSYALYRITQEALRNVQKHAPGAAVTVNLSASSGELHLKIEDSGPGFGPDKRVSERGLGFISMQERARLIGGRLSADSQVGRGTRINVWAPLREEA